MAWGSIGGAIAECRTAVGAPTPTHKRATAMGCATAHSLARACATAGEDANQHGGGDPAETDPNLWDTDTNGFSDGDKVSAPHWPETGSGLTTAAKRMGSSCTNSCSGTSLRRIESETEPPNLATETNAGCGDFQARNPPSPVRIREGLTAKTPRNRGDFSGCARLRAGSLYDPRLNGGAGSLVRTRLCGQFPDLQGSCREILRFLTSLLEPEPKFARLSAASATDSL
jgi:hypothetical protein